MYRIWSLQVNIGLNKVEERVTAFNLDGCDFIRRLCGCQSLSSDPTISSTAGDVEPPSRNIQEGGARTSGEQDSEGGVDATLPEGGVLWHHGIMNLPQTAVQFCTAFRRAFDPRRWRGRLPWVHCYTFQKHETQAGV
jgi:tRNA (guanine37-N1)-methyltransferase